MNWKKFAAGLAVLSLGLSSIVPLMPNAEEEPVPIDATEEPSDARFYVQVSINTLPEKLLYHVGEELDLTGLTVSTEQTYFGEWIPDESNVPVTESTDKFQVTGFSSAHPGVQTIAVTYRVYNDVLQEYVCNEAYFEVIVTDQGDVNADGTLNATDLTLFQNFLHGTENLSADGMQNADMNGDGELDIFDLALMKRNLKQHVPEYMELTPTIQMDVTNAVTHSGWQQAFSRNAYNTYVITNSQDMLFYADNYLQPAAARSLKNTYDEDFFKDNILILHLSLQSRDTYETAVSDISYIDGKLTVTTEKQEIDGFTDKGVQVWRIAVPRSQYNGKGVTWQEKDTVSIFGAYSTTDLVEYCGMNDFELKYDSSLYFQSTLVTSQKELQSYLSQILDDAGVEAYSAPYDANFFADNVLYFRMSDDIAGVNDSAWQITKTGNVITVDVKTNAAYGCIVDLYLDCLALSRKYVDADTTVKFRENTLPQYQTLDGTMQYYDGLGKQPTLAVNQYSFGDEHEIALYWSYPVGMVLYENNELIESVAVSADASQFSYDYTVNSIVRTETMLDDTEVWENTEEGFSLAWGTDSVTVHFLKSKSTGEEYSITIPYPENA